ncbi:class I SAM-dependent methyltransferase [Azomonas macrocytogenes]|uniref:Phospholipid N-methyltransferase n=1 Tax=Azomonas macrocytogenes TaxID=69962 RepID=A0A839SZA0_AZOMA|nr:phospholipid methyltransferase [Azomonas macrocytogenes]MBB3102009.1 phospholipid N-methyltransferase [Azomonas macrocytogenes]
MFKSDLLTFFLAWAANPLQVASIIPSGDRLCALITSEISSETGPVIEFGPGTGVFTRALLDCGVRQQDLTLIEFGDDFANMLRLRYPEARVLQMDAQRLARHALYAGRPVGAVVSGLPLLSMSPRQVMGILRGAFCHMRDGGNFYQFTYGPRCPVPRPILDRLGLKAVRLGRELRNFPPATVYRISRCQPMYV